MRLKWISGGSQDQEWASGIGRPPIRSGPNWGPEDDGLGARVQGGTGMEGGAGLTAGRGGPGRAGAGKPGSGAQGRIGDPRAAAKANGQTASRRRIRSPPPTHTPPKPTVRARRQRAATGRHRHSQLRERATEDLPLELQRDGTGVVNAGADRALTEVHRKPFPVGIFGAQARIDGADRWR